MIYKKSVFPGVQIPARPVSRIAEAIVLIVLTWMCSAFPVLAQLQVPAIPSNTQLSNQYEYDAEYIYRVSYEGSYLEDGTLIAYVNGQLRGAQSASVLFPPTGNMVYSVRVFSNNPSGDTITFRYYDVFHGKVYEIIEKELFGADHVPDYYSPTQLHAACVQPGQPAGLLPDDGAGDQNATLDFFWQPSENALFYSLYLWKDGDPEPATPHVNNIYGTSTRVYNLTYGTTYHWFIRSVNQCLQNTSVTHTFTVRQLPDLIMPEISAPETVLSATPFELNYTVKNQGPGSTFAATWYDAFFISADNSLSGDDQFLGQTERKNQLEPDSSYQHSIILSIPAGYAGDYYIIGVTDRGNRIAEGDNNNNNNQQPAEINVGEKPLPDVKVGDITADAYNYEPGDSITVSWKIDNIGDADAEGGWTERVSIVSLSGIRLDLDGTPQFTGVLEQGTGLTRNYRFRIPEVISFSGEAYVEVVLKPSAQLLEYPGDEVNNKSVSANRIMLQSRLYLTLPASAKEDYTGQVRCYVTRSGNFTQALTIALASSPSGQITLPSSVTIPERSSTALFDITMVDNALLDGPRQVEIEASAPGFLSVSEVIEVLDDEEPTLTLSLNKNTGFEGDTLVLTISRDLAGPDSAVVYLSTSSISQWSFPASVTIKGNEGSAQAAVVVTDNTVPELDEDAVIMARSEGMISGSTSATIVDDDIPEIAFEILADSVSESAGPYATWGVIRRIGGNTGAIRINLAASISNALYFPASVTLDQNVAEKQFNIGVIDNAQVEGFRTVEITGSIYISSCNCGTTPDNGGVVSDFVVIADNDGPALTVTVSPVTLKEGVTGAGTMTVSRNTPTSTSLNLSLSSSDISELTVPSTAVIPAGQSSVKVSMDTKDDGIDDGSQTVTLQAGAAGFSPGMAWVSVTDINRPDLEMSDIELREETIITGRQMEVQALVENRGFGKAPSGIPVRFYLSKDDKIDDKDSVIYEGTLPDPIPIGESVQFLDLITVPRMTGNYYLIGKVNPDATVTELLYINNESAPVPVTLLPAYTGKAFVDEAIFKEPQPVTIYGQAKMADGGIAVNVDLDVYIITGSLRRVIEVTTDQEGDFTTLFEPYSYESGHYSVGACYPGQSMEEEQDAFDILGMERASKEFLIWNVKKSVPTTGTIGIRNRSNAPLTQITFETGEIPEGFNLTIDTIDILPGNQVIEFHFTVLGEVITDSRNYIEIPVRVSSAEGISFEFNAFYYCQALGSHLISKPASINTTITKGKSRYFDLKVINDGAGETGVVAVELPDQEWMSLASPDTIENMEPGDTITVTLLFTTGNDLPLNTPISGRIAVHNENGDDLAVPFRIEVVSEETGSLKVDVVDEYTYFTEEAPHVQNAHVVVRHPYSGKIVAEGFTGPDGIFEADSLPEGSYRMTVEAAKHEGYQNIIVIDPGRVNEQSVFLSFQAITYTWEVVPTEIEDAYEIVLVMEYETNVPVPVVIVEMPDEMPELFGDEKYTFLVTLTNKGLITAKGVQIRFPENDAEYEWVTNFTEMDLLAQQSIQIPVTMQRKTTPKLAGGSKNGSEDCIGLSITLYWIECGEDKQWHVTETTFDLPFRICGYDDVPADLRGRLEGENYLRPGPPSGPGDYWTFPLSNVPYAEMSSNDCDPCLLKLLSALLSCLGGNIGGVLGCITSFIEGGMDWSDLPGCIPGLPGCIASVYDLVVECYLTPPFGPGAGGGGGYAKNALDWMASKGNPVPPIILQAVTELTYVVYNDQAERDYLSEYMGDLDWDSKDNLQDFMTATNDEITSKVPFDPQSVDDIKEAMLGTDITGDEVDAFCSRWNRTLEAWSKGISSPTPQYPDIISQDSLESYHEKMKTAMEYADSLGYSSVGDMKNKATQTLLDELQNQRSSVCASVSIKISQRLVMTREAFEGTLTIFNGNTTSAMEEVELNLEIRNSDGELANDLFEIETKALDILTGIDGTGSLGPEQTGSATILFIPEKGAAPEVPESYSFGGSFSYLDPYTGVKVERPLFPVTLDVNPSPDLFLHYFMQRDILGDDPLTDPIEPIVPAELAVMIENNGYGTAKNVRIESAQPEIIDNEKGLAIHFELIGSNLNGQPRQLGLTNIDFGNIAPKTTSVGQWWFTADLLGHFVNYEATVTHLDSRGNPDLSLVSGAELHELIHSIRIYGPTDDGINDFLVNAYQDSEERPDVIYASQGQLLLDVHAADAGLFEGTLNAPAFTNTLKVYASRLGWNTIRLPDPGDGRFEVAGVTRNSDQQMIPLDNAWQTHVTLPDGKEPIYENKFHFVDLFEEIGVQEYTVVWKLKAQNPPAIVSIDGAPGSFVSHPVTSLNIRFNKEIDPATFTYHDMVLRLQGGEDIMDSTIVITKIDPLNYHLDLSSLTTGNGFYVLTVQAAEIQDMDGTKGKVGKQVSWTQFLNVPMVEEFIGLPENEAGSPFEYLLVRFNLPIDVNTLLPSRFIVSKDGVPVAGAVTVILMDTEARLFKISGLETMMTSDGTYILTVDLPNIATIDGAQGLIRQEVEWIIDTTPPTMISITEITDGGFDEQHVTGMEIVFNEGIKGFGMTSLELWKDDSRLPLSQIHIDSLSGTIRVLSQFRLLTYYEGEYILKVNMNTVYDRAGITGDGIEEFRWNVDRTPPGQVENMRITPDLGYSATDGITATRTLDVIMDVPDQDVKIELYKNDFGALTMLAERSNVMQGELSLPVKLPSAGNILLEVYCIDERSNLSITQLPVVVDESAFRADFQDVPQEPVINHPEVIALAFSERVLASTVTKSCLSLRLKGEVIDLAGIVVQQVNDTLYTLSGFDQLDNPPGEYKLAVDLTKIEKYVSGMKGTYAAETGWTILDVNEPPVADAGEDFSMVRGEQYWLNASGSYDPDDDALDYQWFPPDGIVLDNPYSVSPSFTAEEVNGTTEFTFLLSVSDGRLYSTDRVNAYLLDVSVDDRLHEGTVVLYPNPSKGFITLAAPGIQVETIRLVDFSGKVIMHLNWTGENEQTLNLDGVPAGLYVVQVYTSDDIIVEKIVIL